MLAIRVTPFVKQTQKLQENNKKRKRNVTFSNTVESLPFIANDKITDGQSNGILTSSVERNAMCNGVVGRPVSKKIQKVANKSSGKVCNGDTQTNYDPELLKRLHGKAPGGKKFPTLNKQADDQLVVSVSRNLVASTKSRKRKTRFEVLNDSRNDSQADSDTASTNGSNDSSSDFHHLNSRKRTINNSSLSNEADTNSSDQPVTKKSCLLSEEPIDHTSSPIPPTFKPQQQHKIYTAELVAFDSRQECLIVDGEYELLLQCCSPIDTKNSKPTVGDIYVLPSLNQDTILSMDQSSISQVVKYRYS